MFIFLNDFANFIGRYIDNLFVYYNILGVIYPSSSSGVSSSNSVIDILKSPNSFLEWNGDIFIDSFFKWVKNNKDLINPDIYYNNV